MKVIQVIKKIVTGILMVAFFAFAITMTILLLYRNKYGVTQIDTTSFVIINDEISSENYKKGDLVFVKKTKVEKINKGDEVFGYKVDKDGVPHIDLGTVDEIHIKENAISYENGATYSDDFIIGKADKVHNKVGTYLGVIQSTWGFLFIVLIPCFLLFIHQIYTLVIEIKYGSEETAN